MNNSNKSVKIEVVLNTADYSTASTVDSILVLDKAGLIAKSGILNNYFDMYRWWRMDKLTCESVAEQSTTSGDVPFFSALIQPDAVDPTDALDFETPYQHLNVRNPASAASNKLILGKPALAQIGNKMPTHSDAAIETLDSYGTLWHGTIGNNLDFARYSKITVHLEFFVLTDPDTLALYIKQRVEKEQTKKPQSSAVVRTLRTTKTK